MRQRLPLALLVAALLQTSGAAPVIGRPTPSLAGPTLDDRALDLAALRGGWWW